MNLFWSGHQRCTARRSSQISSQWQNAGLPIEDLCHLFLSNTPRHTATRDGKKQRTHTHHYLFTNHSIILSILYETNYTTQQNNNNGTSTRTTKRSNILKWTCIDCIQEIFSTRWWILISNGTMEEYRCWRCDWY